MVNRRKMLWYLSPNKKVWFSVWNPSVLPPQLGHRGVGDLQCLLWSDGVAASLGELPADVKQGAAAALCAQQTLWRGPPRWETNLQPLPVPCFLASWTLDPGTTSETRRLFTKSQSYFTTWSPLKWLDYLHLPSLWTTSHFLLFELLAASFPLGYLKLPSFWNTSDFCLPQLPLPSLSLDFDLPLTGQLLCFSFWLPLHSLWAASNCLLPELPLTSDFLDQLFLPLSGLPLTSFSSDCSLRLDYS